MKHVLTYPLDPGTTITIDPMDKQPEKYFWNDIYRDYTGLIPNWLCVLEDTPLYKQAIDGYPCYSSDLEGGDIDRETLEYKYPGDPPLPPMVVYKRTVNRFDGTSFQDVFIVYQHGFVGGIYTDTEERVRITRMD